MSVLADWNLPAEKKKSAVLDEWPLTPTAPEPPPEEQQEPFGVEEVEPPEERSTFGKAVDWVFPHIPELRQQKEVQERKRAEKIEKAKTDPERIRKLAEEAKAAAPPGIPTDTTDWEETIRQRERMSELYPQMQSDFLRKFGVSEEYEKRLREEHAGKVKEAQDKRKTEYESTKEFNLRAYGDKEFVPEDKFNYRQEMPNADPFQYMVEHVAEGRESARRSMEATRKWKLWELRQSHPDKSDAELDEIAHWAGVDTSGRPKQDEEFASGFGLVREALVGLPSMAFEELTREIGRGFGPTAGRGAELTGKVISLPFEIAHAYTDLLKLDPHIKGNKTAEEAIDLFGDLVGIATTHVMAGGVADIKGDIRTGFKTGDWSGRVPLPTAAEFQIAQDMANKAVQSSQRTGGVVGAKEILQRTVEEEAKQQALLGKAYEGQKAADWERGMELAEPDPHEAPYMRPPEAPIFDKEMEGAMVRDAIDHVSRSKESLYDPRLDPDAPRPGEPEGFRDRPSPLGPGFDAAKAAAPPEVRAVLEAKEAAFAPPPPPAPPVEAAVPLSPEAPTVAPPEELAPGDVTYDNPLMQGTPDGGTPLDPYALKILKEKYGLNPEQVFGKGAAEIVTMVQEVVENRQTALAENLEGPVQQEAIKAGKPPKEKKVPKGEQFGPHWPKGKHRPKTEAEVPAAETPAAAPKPKAAAAEAPLAKQEIPEAAPAKGSANPIVTELKKAINRKGEHVGLAWLADQVNSQPGAWKRMSAKHKDLMIEKLHEADQQFNPYGSSKGQTAEVGWESAQKSLRLAEKQRAAIQAKEAGQTGALGLPTEGPPGVGMVLFNPHVQLFVKSVSDAVGKVVDMVSVDRKAGKYEGFQEGTTMKDELRLKERNPGRYSGLALDDAKYATHPLKNLSYKTKQLYLEKMVLEDELRRTTEGQRQESGDTAQIAAKIAAIDPQINPAIFNEFRRRYMENSEKYWKAAHKSRGIADADIPQMPDHAYVPHHVLDFHEGGTLDFSGRAVKGMDVVQLKEAKGSTLGIERDPIRAQMQQASSTYRAEVNNEFNQKLADTHSLNDQLRAQHALGDPLDVTGIGVYSLRSGQAITEIGKVRSIIRDALQAEAAAGVTVGGEFASGWHAFEKPLVEGLAEHQSRYSQLEHSWRAGLFGAQRAVRGAVWTHNPIAQFSHLIGDHVLMLQAVPPHLMGKVFKNYGSNLAEMVRGMWEQHNGKRSRFLEGMRRDGHMGGVFGEMEAASKIAEIEGNRHIMSEEQLPMHMQGAGRRVLSTAKEIANFLPHQLEFRQSAMRKAIADIWENEQGVSHGAAINHAHRMMIDFGEASPIERILGPMMSFTKTPIETFKNLTARLLKDPKTGSLNMKMLYKGVVPLLAAQYLLRHYLNHRDKETADFTDHDLPNYGHKTMLVGGKNENGSRKVWEFYSSLPMVDTLADSFNDAVHGRGSDILEKSIRGFVSHIGGLPKALADYGSGVDVATGRPIVPESIKRLSEEDQKTYVVRRGGFRGATPAQQHFIDSIGGVFANSAERFLGREDMAPTADDWSSVRPLLPPIDVKPGTRQAQELGADYNKKISEMMTAIQANDKPGLNVLIGWMQTHNVPPDKLRADLMKSGRRGALEDVLSPAEQRVLRLIRARGPT